MVITKLTGGVGNQLFQYAIGKQVAIRNKCRLKFDISSYNEDKLRAYKLDNFQINADIASDEEVNYLTQKRIYGKRHLIQLALDKYGIIKLPKVYYNMTEDFWDNMLTIKDNCYLEGYWQSEKYFYNFSEIIRKELQPKISLPEVCTNLINRSNNKRTVSIHIRRGDYVENKSLYTKHGICSTDYYTEALSIQQKLHYIENAFIFTDDIAWVKKNFIINLPSLIVSEFTKSDIEDLVLMSSCSNHIIANSSFSWWGAWLANNKGNTVICPNNWFADQSMDNPHMIPHSWIKI